MAGVDARWVSAGVIYFLAALKLRVEEVFIAPAMGLVRVLINVEVGVSVFTAKRPAQWVLRGDPDVLPEPLYPRHGLWPASTKGSAQRLQLDALIILPVVTVAPLVTSPWCLVEALPVATIGYVVLVTPSYRFLPNKGLSFLDATFPIVVDVDALTHAAVASVALVKVIVCLAPLVGFTPFATALDHACFPSSTLGHITALPWSILQPGHASE